MASTSGLIQIADVNAAGTLYNTFTTAKSMLTSSTATGASTGFVPLWPGFWRVGGSLLIKFAGEMSWATGNTMTFSILVGAAAVFTSGALKVTTTGGTTEPVRGEILLTCRTVGNGTLATVEGDGWISGRGICPPGATAGANYSAGMGYSGLSEATPAVGSGFDSTVQNTLDFQLAMGTSSASNGFQLRQYNVVSLGNTAP